MEPKIEDLSLYVHIPFCKKKCIYCDFLSFSNCDYAKQKSYINALCKEIESYRPIAFQYKVTTIFIGGGTPSYIEATFLKQVMNSIYHTFKVDEQAEITIEGNPDSLEKDKLKIYREVGINRLSIGLQSANDQYLKVLGRVHNYDQFVAAYLSAREVGFNNINVDLISGIPGEKQESYIRTLAKIVELQPEHISAYSLIVEDGTPLSSAEELLELLPTEEEDRLLYSKTKMFLKNSGYHRYEISNYAKSGFECKHNLVYWTGGEYLGVGLGASSYLKVRINEERLEKIRFHGIENLNEYVARFSNCEGMREDAYTNIYHLYEASRQNENDIQGVREDADALYDFYEDMDISSGMTIGMDLEIASNSENHNLKKYREYEESPMLEFIRDYYKDLYFLKRKDEMEEFMFLGLRTMNGVSKEEFYRRFQVKIESVYEKVIQKYKESGFLCEEEDRLYLSDKGIDVSNIVMAEFML